MNIKELITSIRKKAAGHTCVGTGNFSLDVLAERQYPNGFTIGKRNKFTEHVFSIEIGNTCGNVMTMLPYLGVKSYPIAHFDESVQGFQLTRDLKRYGADVRYVKNSRQGGTTIFRMSYKLDDKTGLPTTGAPSSSAAGEKWQQSHARRKFISSKNGEPEAMAEAIDFTPDVFFYDVAQAGHREVAKLLRQRGTMVYFEPEGDGSGTKSEASIKRLHYSCIEASDIVKFSGTRITDLSFVEKYPDRLYIRTLSSEGIDFKLRDGEWQHLDPIVNPDFADEEGAGDWTSSTLIAVLCGMGLTSVADMTEAQVREAIMMAQQVASASVSYRASKGKIHADNDYVYADDTLEVKRTYTKKLMYLHGSASAGYSKTSRRLLKYIPEDWQLVMPDCPVDAEKCIAMLRELCEREKPDLIIGSSQGGFYAQMLSGFKRICVCPAFDMDKDDDVKVGNHVFVVNRADLVQKYTITPEIQETYRSVEAIQFDHITDYDRKNYWGLFGLHDGYYGHCIKDFRKHYPSENTFTYDGEHGLSEDEVRDVLMPLIEKILPE